MKKNRCLCFSIRQSRNFITLTAFESFSVFPSPVPSVRESFISIAVYHIKIVDRKSFICPFYNSMSKRRFLFLCKEDVVIFLQIILFFPSCVSTILRDLDKWHGQNKKLRCYTKSENHCYQSKGNVEVSC